MPSCYVFRVLNFSKLSLITCNTNMDKVKLYGVSGKILNISLLITSIKVKYSQLILSPVNNEITCFTKNIFKVLKTSNIN